MRINTLWFPSSLSLHLVLGGEGEGSNRTAHFLNITIFIETLGIDSFLGIDCLCSVMHP